MKQKFRVWDKEKKIMIYPKYKNKKAQIIYIYPENFGNEKWELIEVTENVITELLMVNSKNGVLQQSTGLFDKNGKEIFEGDIVRKKGFSPALGKEINELEEIKDIRQVWCPYSIENAIDAGMEEVEIVGNIYEDEKLIKN